tara:strand:- start:684 stop:1049 length:366 start_codon:yes stop_codon:yes gene_type:complete
MKITKQKLVNIIKEELDNVLSAEDEWGRQDEDDFDAYVKAARMGGASYDEADVYAQSMIDRLRPDAQPEDIEESAAADAEEMRNMVRRTYEEEAVQMGLYGAKARAYVKDMMMQAGPRTDS